MANTEPFDRFLDAYEAWFEQNHWAYLSELEAIRRLLPAGLVAEGGVGTGRFAAPLGIGFGLEPSRAMADRARGRGIEVVLGQGELLPFAEASCDGLLMVTTICFLDDLDLALTEAARVLRPEGSLVVGFVDAGSTLGRRYQQRRDQSRFYRTATFYETNDIVARLGEAGLAVTKVAQTLMQDPEDLTDTDAIREGFGQGAFVAIRVERSARPATGSGWRRQPQNRREEERIRKKSDTR